MAPGIEGESDRAPDAATYEQISEDIKKRFTELRDSIDRTLERRLPDIVREEIDKVRIEYLERERSNPPAWADDLPDPEPTPAPSPQATDRVKGVATSFRTWVATTSTAISAWLLQQGVDTDATEILGLPLNVVIAGGVAALGAVLIASDTFRPIGK